MQAVESTLEIHAPEVNKIPTKRRINPWFDHAAHQLKSKRRATERMAQKQNSRKQRKIPTNQ